MTTEQKSGVSFFTCCYEADWEFFLKEGRLKEMISRCNYPFASRNLVINNVNNKPEVERYALKAVEEGVIDRFYFSEHYIQEALQKFSLTRRSFKLDGYDGYWYSVAPLTAAYICDSTYLFYCTGDCMLNAKYDLDWIGAGIKKLEAINIFCVMPFWNYYKPESESFLDEDEFCYYDNGFTDQVFLVRTGNFAANVYNEYNVLCEKFPIYGGNHFERRVFCYMNNRQYLRCVFKNIIYTHEKLIKADHNPPKKSGITNELKYLIAKAKRKFRRKNVLTKLLLR